MINDLSKRIQYLEEKFAFQEQTVDALNDMILEQQKQINELEEQLVKLKQQLSYNMQQTADDQDPPPPHY